MHSRFKKSLPDLYEDGRYIRVLHVNGKPVLVSTSSTGTIKNPELLVEAYPRLRKNSEIASLKQTLRSTFEPPFDFRKLYVIAKKDRLMRRIARELGGLRPIPPPTIFESVIIAITEQQISLHAANATRSRLIQRYDDRVVRDGRTFWAFPTPKPLARARLGGMRKIGLSAV